MALACITQDRRVVKIKKATRIVNVRLPGDHWLFKEKNMSSVIRDALDFYEKFQCELSGIKQSVQEVKDVLSSGQLVINNDNGNVNQTQGNREIDPRLADVLDDFLDF